MTKRYCPNASCVSARQLGSSAEYRGDVEVCPLCGSDLINESGDSVVVGRRPDVKAVDERIASYTQSKIRFYAVIIGVILLVSLTGRILDPLLGLDSGSTATAALFLLSIVGLVLGVREFRRQQGIRRRRDGTDLDIGGDIGPYPNSDLDFPDFGGDAGGDD